MERKEFLKLATLTIACATFGVGLKSCSENSTSPVNVDFTIDLTQPEFAQLNEIGGYVVYNSVIIIRKDANTFVALSSKCTHEGFTLDYDASKNKIICNKHNSEFNLDGSVTNGPAKKSLQKFNVKQNGNLLRIYS
jgi:cytochrome b6-f complex iron-sulfur subunit